MFGGGSALSLEKSRNKPVNLDTDHITYLYQDTYKDMMHSTYSATGSGKYATKSNPSVVDPEANSEEGCEGLHYHFVGWVAEDYINEDGTLKTEAAGFEIVPAGKSNHCASGTTYYAVWAEEE